MRKLKVILLSLLLILFSGVVSAQDEIPAAELCTDAGKSFMAEQFQLLADNFTTADDEALGQALHILSGLIGSYQAQCNGFVFSSDDYDAFDQVIGPIEFPDGFYRVTLTAGEYTSVSVEQLAGDCGFGNLLSTLSDETEDNGIWEFEGCRALLDISAREPWTLTVEPIE